MADSTTRQMDPLEKKHPSLADVAALAGVSAGTVSRALSRPEMISEATRERVFSAVRKLRYVPNGAARALAMRRSMTIGAVVPRFGVSSFSTLVQALESTVAEAGYTLVLSVPEPHRPHETSGIKALLERGVDAMAVLGYEHEPEIFTQLQNQGMPFVRLWAQPSTPWPGIGFDEHAAAELVVSHLSGLDHRNVAFIGGRTENNERARRRREGITLALSRHGMKLSREATIETEYGFREGYEAMQTLLQRDLNITAVICGNDYLAAGALAALNGADIEIPGRLSVVSFNDNDFAAYLHPPLTTVHLPIDEIGKEAGRYLLSRLEGKAATTPEDLPMRLVERQSSGPAKPRP